MACKRFGNSTSIKLLSNYTSLSKMTSTLTSMPQMRKISQTSAPSQSGLQQLSHINPELISRIEKQLAAQGTQIMCNVMTYNNYLVKSKKFSSNSSYLMIFSN